MPMVRGPLATDDVAMASIAPYADISRFAKRPRVLIAGGGVAGMEALFALKALAGDRVDLTILAPELKCHDAASEIDARWHRGAVARVEHERHRAFTTDGDELAYDTLVLAIGARQQRAWTSASALTYRGGRDAGDYRLLLGHLGEGRIHRLAFVKPSGASWPLPLYDLVLTTAAYCAVHELPDVELSLITPEEEPLSIFGKPVSAAIGRLLRDAGVALHAGSYAVPRARGWLDISPGQRRLPVDRVVTQPRLVGPRLRGIPSGRDGFIQIDAHGRLPGLDDVFAAGDATNFPVKQGAVAAQQADAVAEAIAASMGVPIEPQPFRPILRGLLLTGEAARYVRADISGAAGDDSSISGTALWWPPDKIVGRYLAPYLSSRLADANGGMPSRGSVDFARP